MGIGLVLGGGGVVGVAWETGVVAGLAEASGWDPTRATVVVGTSAGSIVGSNLRHGVPLDEMVTAARRRSDVPTSASAGGQASTTGTSAGGDPAAAMEVFRRWSRADDVDAAAARDLAALAARASALDEAGWVAAISSQLPAADWPADPLVVTALSAASGETVCWTRADGVPLGTAVAASCAVPGLFPPVTVEGARYLDGGVRSGSHADAVLGHDVDVAVFVGPMVGDEGIGRVARRALDREREALAARDVVLHEIVPGPAFAATGLTLMDAARAPEALELGLADGAEAARRVGPALR